MTVSYSQIESIGCYIENQRDHQWRRTFGEETIQLLKRHGIELDDRPLFESERGGDCWRRLRGSVSFWPASHGADAHGWMLTRLRRYLREYKPLVRSDAPKWGNS